MPLAGLRNEQRKDTRQHQLTLFELKEDSVGRNAKSATGRYQELASQLSPAADMFTRRSRRLCADFVAKVVFHR